jgi:serine/threonine-protein kinase
MGAVYQATHALLKKPVAIKLLHPRLRGSDESQARFLREAEIAARVRHHNVVYITDVGVEHDVCYLVMELLEGEDLATRLQRGGALDIVDAVDTVVAIAAGLAAVHREGIVHRDVKPENVLLAVESDQVVPKLIDFGVSKDLMTPSGAQTITGTPKYMAPEQAAGAPVDGRADEYSLAVIAYECITGRVPYESPSLMGLMQLIEAGQYRPVRELNPAVPHELEAAIARATAVDPKDRFPTVAEFGAALLPFASAAVRARLSSEFSMTEREPRTVSTREPVVGQEPTLNVSVVGKGPAPPRSRGATYALGGLAVVALGTWGLFLSRPSEFQEPSRDVNPSAATTIVVQLPAVSPSVPPRAATPTVAATATAEPRPAASASAPRRAPRLTSPAPSASAERDRGLAPRSTR